MLYLSHGFQPAVEKAIGDAHGAKLDALDGIALHGATDDPHVWLDPVLFARIVRRIGAALHAAGAGANGSSGELRGVDREYRAGLADCEQRELVTTHAAFGYLAARYRLTQVAITGIEPEAEPSAQTPRRPRRPRSAATTSRPSSSRSSSPRASPTRSRARPARRPPCSTRSRG